MSLDVMDGIGLVGDVLGIVGFIKDLVPDDPPAEGATVRVKAGNPGDDNPGLDGDLSAAYGWDTNNNYLGESDGDHLEIGDTADVVIDQFSGGSRADYIGISVGDNALCVAWITVGQQDGTEGGAWTGDIGAACGQAWYAQTEKAGKLKDSDQDYVPKCTWLDGDHTGSTENAAMKFRVDAYGKDVVATADKSEGCKWTNWGADDAPINAAPGSKRDIAKRAPWMDDVLVVSNITSHKAADLCNSATSRGPDFIGTDGYFCDMDKKKLSPLCSTKNVHGCVNVNELRGAKQLTRRSFGFKRATDSDAKDYKKINHWN